MSYDVQQLGSDEAFNRSTAAGHLEVALQELIYQGLAAFSSTEEDLEQGLYRIYFNDDKYVQVQIDFAAQGLTDVHTVPCVEWVRWQGELPGGVPLDRGAGTWREAVAWLRGTAETAESEKSPPTGRS